MRMKTISHIDGKNVVLGIFIIYLFQAVLSIIISSHSTIPTIINNKNIRYITSLFSMLIGGVIVGYRTKNNSPLNAGLTGAILSLIFILLNLAGYFTNSNEIFINLSLTTINKNILLLPIAIIITTIGGYFGGKVNQKND